MRLCLALFLFFLTNFFGLPTLSCSEDILFSKEKEGYRGDCSLNSEERLCDLLGLMLPSNSDSKIKKETIFFEQSKSLVVLSEDSDKSTSFSELLSGSYENQGAPTLRQVSPGSKIEIVDEKSHSFNPHPALYADRLYRPVEKNEPRDEKASSVAPQSTEDKEEEKEQQNKEVRDNLQKKEQERKRSNSATPFENRLEGSSEKGGKKARADIAFTQKKLRRASTLYLEILKENRCDKWAYSRLLDITTIWSLKARHKYRAIHIYSELLLCRPNDPDLLFYLARELVWIGRLNDGERILNELLLRSPQNQDASALLVKLYIRQKKWKKSYIALAKYPQIKGKDLDYATIAYRRGNYHEAESIYRGLLRTSPNDERVRLALAKTYSAERKYKASKREYARLLQSDPNRDQFLREYMEVRAHTNVGVFFEGSYTKSKEGDPDLKALVVRDFYTYAGYHVFIPLSDALRLNFKQLFFNQKEEDIYPPKGLNYNAFLEGVQLSSQLLFMKFLRWEVDLRLLTAKGHNHHAFFPFVSTTRFEPGSSLVFSSPSHYLILNAHVESFVYKNFQKFNSELLRTFYLHGGYVFRPEVFLMPEIEASFDEVFYHDSIRNRRNTFNLWGKFNLYFPFARFIYRFENSHFRHPTEDYFSFTRQFRNTLGALLRIDFTKRLYLEGEYLYRWEYNIGLNQPIGSFIFQTDVQRLRSYHVFIKGGYRIRDQFRIEVAGHLFYTTLPYNDYNVRGNLLWQF